jgi:hypothetical protein
MKKNKSLYEVILDKYQSEVEIPTLLLKKQKLK